MRINLIGECRTSALQTLHFQLFQFLLLLFMNTIKIVCISEEYAHHTQHYELEGKDDRTTIKIGTYKNCDTLIYAKDNKRIKNVGEYSTFERLCVEDLLVHEQ